MKPIATRRIAAALAIAAVAAGAIAGSSSSAPRHQKAPQVMAFETESLYCGYAYSPATCDDAGTRTAGTFTVAASARRYQH